MARSTLYLIIVVLGFFAVMLIVFTAFYFKQPTSVSGEPLTCNIIRQNVGPEKGIDIVFFFDNVEEKEADAYINYLLNVTPFSENKEKFNFYSVNMLPSCEITNGILICYSREIIKAGSLCPNEYIFVLSKQSSSIRSSSYMNLMSINLANKKPVIIHEFSHAFANLADEYIPSTIPRGSKNCVSSCENFEGDVDGCFKGCSNNEYYRSIEAGIMRTLSTTEYGKLDYSIVQEDLSKYG